MKCIRSLLLILISSLLLSCGGKKGEIEESTTMGKITIGVDDAYKLLIDAEIFVFESTYKYAKINPVYASEGEILDQLFNDSVRLVVMSRQLTANEKKYFTDQKIFPREKKIAYDGLALITNKSALDTTFSYDQLKDLFTGKAARWSDFDPAGSSDSIKVVFDDPRSGNARYLRELFGLQKLPSYCYAVKSNEEVLKYVEEKPGSIGIIGSNYISDPDDSVTYNFLSRIKVIGVSSKDDPKAVNGYHQPYQEYISDGSYPFKREVFVVSRELGTRLGAGFTSFMTGDIGQKIVLRSGLLPAQVPVRFVNIVNE